MSGIGVDLKQIIDLEVGLKNYNVSLICFFSLSWTR
jgi:hypothetical protein